MIPSMEGIGDQEETLDVVRVVVVVVVVVEEKIGMGKEGQVGNRVDNKCKEGGHIKWGRKRKRNCI